MDNKKLIKTLQDLKKDSKKRNFSQSIDLIVVLRDLNMKDPNDQVDFHLQLNKGLGKKLKIGAFTGAELQESAKGVVDTIVSQTDFDKYAKDKKLAKKLADDHDYFIAQAEVMPKVAAAFGRVLGPRGKMPNPKIGAVVPGKANIESLYERLQKTVKIQAKKTPMIQVKVGDETMKEEDVVENLVQVFNQVLLNLPKERSNVKKVYLKLTMGKPVELDI